MNKKIKIALIGCGQWGKNIARNLLEMKALMCVYDPESNEAKNFTLKNNLSDFSLNEIYSNKNIDGVVIATPAHTHKDIALEAIKNNKDILIEKKFASSFFETTLAADLRQMNVDSVVVSGVTTSGCVRATALDSLQNNFLTLVAEDCVGDRDLNAHRANLFDLQSKYADVVHSEQIFKLF